MGGIRTGSATAFVRPRRGRPSLSTPCARRYCEDGAAAGRAYATRRAAALLASADVVVTDRLVPTSTLALLPPTVRVIDVGKQPQHHPVPQEEINALLVSEATAGHGVVRFKGGDPYVLGRGGEERLACEEAGIAFLPWRPVARGDAGAEAEVTAVAAELDAKRAIRQGTELAAAL